MAIVDLAGNPLAPATIGQMLGFVEVTAEEQLTLQMYNFLLRPIRHADEQQGNLFLKRYFDGPQAVWETTQSTIFALKDLWSVTDCPDELLQYLKNIVGWTKEPITKRITDALTPAELRRLIAISVPYWQTRGPEDAIINILGAITGQRSRIWNWFDFRWVLDETETGDDHQGRDPWIIELPEDGDDEYRSNVRIVDPVLPTPIDRDLVVNVLKLSRPIGERIEVSFIDFLDRFLVVGDFEQWTLAAGTAIVVADGLLQLSDTALLEEAAINTTEIANATNWASGILAYARMTADTAGDIGLRVLRVDALNFYEARFDVGSFPAPATVTLRKMVAGVPTVLGSVALLQAVELGEFVGLRVSVEPTGVTNKIVVSIDGDAVIDITDPDLTQGAASVFHFSGGDLSVDEVEIFETPLATRTIDINAA